ncbi:MAG: undecaprenyl-diphosphate phosphatase [Halanaerobiales bacterium]
MGFLKVIILGLVQGLTEFLPISSSGHLVIFQELLDIGKEELTLDIFLHFGTVIPILIIFRKDVWDIITFKNKKLTWLILIGMAPTGLMGILLKDFFTGLFSSVRLVGFMLLITGLLLYLVEKISKSRFNLKSMKWYHGVVVGIAQGMAIIPGISRSGSTIAAALFQGLDRESAARYSFLLSAPVIMGAGILVLKDIMNVGLKDMSWLMIIAGVLAAAFSGYFAIKYLLQILKEGRLTTFSYYCWTVGILIILLAGYIG